MRIADNVRLKLSVPSGQTFPFDFAVHDMVSKAVTFINTLFVFKKNCSRLNQILVSRLRREVCFLFCQSVSAGMMIELNVSGTIGTDSFLDLVIEALNYSSGVTKFLLTLL